MTKTVNTPDLKCMAPSVHYMLLITYEFICTVPVFINLYDMLYSLTK
jgi:hypothetical protein